MFVGILTRDSGWDIIAPNLTITVFGLLTFAAVIFLLFVLGERSSVKAQEWIKYLVFLVPALFLLTIGLIYPAIRTLILSFMDARSENFIGLDNYVWAFTRPEILIVLRNTLIWTLAVPLFSTAIGLAIAYFTDRMKRGAWVKSLIFMPMAISFVGVLGYLEVRLPVRTESEKGRHRFDERHRQGAGRGESAQLAARGPDEHLPADHRHGLDSDRIRNGRAGCGNEEHPRRDRRGIDARWCLAVKTLLVHHDSNDSLHDCGGGHHRGDRNPEGVRYRPHHDRWKLPNQRDCQRDVQPGIPAAQHRNR